MKKLFFLIPLLAFGFSKKQSSSSSSSSSSSVAAASKMKTLFPEQSWADHALQEVKKSKLASAKPRDATSFCPKGMSAENWVHLLASMAKYESSFKPSTTYKESFKNSKGEYVISTGLLQLSYESVAGYGFRVTTEQLKDPKQNLTIGIKILEKWVTQDGVITSGGSPYRGGARYWSVLRSSGKLSSVKATLKPLCQ